MRTMTATADDPPVTEHLGWFWNPFDQRWEAQVGPNRWLIAGHDFNVLPKYSPWQLA